MVAVADAELTQLITTGAPEQDIRNHLRQTATPSLTTDALTKSASGLTSTGEARKMTWA